MGLFSGRPAPGSGQRAGGSQPGPTYWGIGGPQDLIPPRPFLRPNWPVVTNDTALRHSAVWACLRIRADLISTLPVDVYRMLGGIEVAASKPPVLLAPGGPEVDWMEWMYSTQFDLDRCGNTVGLITATDGFGLPARIELCDINTVTVKVKEGRINKFKIGNAYYDPGQVWHEKQFTVAGLHVGLSPVAYARWAIGEYLTVQEFATDWFGNGAVPKAKLTNKAKTLNGPEIATVKEAWRAALATDEPLVTGSDWDYEMISASEASADWIEAKKFSVTDLCRFFGVPSEIIDSAPTGETRGITYANISQRHLAFLIVHLGPAILRRENAITRRLLPAPKFCRLNADALLRLDPISRSQVIGTLVRAKVITADEARALENRAPLTAAQIAQIDHFWPPPGAAPAADDGTPASPGDALPDGDVIPGVEELARKPLPHLREFTPALNGRH